MDDVAEIILSHLCIDAARVAIFRGAFKALLAK
jgi:hypothetical protein